MIILGTNSIKDTGYDVANSLRFDTNASLTKTPSGAGNRKTWTFSAWIKGQPTTPTNSMSGQAIYSAGTSTTNRTHFFISDGAFSFRTEISDSQKIITTNRLFVDPSSWYHFVVAVDTTQGTDTNRVKIYVNGVQETSFSSASYPSQNDDTFVNNTQAQYIGRSSWSASSYFNGYMAEVVLLDGTAATPTSFGEFDEDSGIWKPIDVSGLTFGTNGFYLDFEDSANLGNDANGGTDLTEANIAATDQSTDTCTNNFSTLNPLISPTSSAPTYSEGNLKVVTSTGGNFGGVSSFGVSSGKWYFEIKFTAESASNMGNINLSSSENAREMARTNQHANQFPSEAYPSFTYEYPGDVYKDSGSSVGNYGGFAVGDIVMIAMDLDNQFAYFGVNGTWGNSSDPTSGATGTGGAAMSTNSESWHLSLGDRNSSNTSTYEVNFGNPTFTISSGNTDGNGYGNFEYSVPSGYYSLNTKNLAEYG